MKNLTIFHWLLLLPAFMLLLLSLGLAGLILAFAPPVVSWVAGGLFVVVLLWFILARGRGARVVTEGSLMGRQSSKEGLL